MIVGYVLIPLIVVHKGRYVMQNNVKIYMYEWKYSRFYFFVTSNKNQYTLKLKTLGKTKGS